jgi:citrate lyase beta subunit
MPELVARCLLFTPGNRPERFVKAKEANADGIIIDLEDAIALPEKDSARDIILHYFANHQKNAADKFIQALRINSIKTHTGLKDLSALCETNIRPDIIVLPKVESAAEIEIINQVLAPNTIPILALIETAKGMYTAQDIARADNLIGLVFGGADYAADLGATMDWEALYGARLDIVKAAAQAGISAVDVPYLHLHDTNDSGVIAETKRIKALGFTCKLAIHPKHIKPIINALTPTTEEIEKAQRIVTTYEHANGNACEIDGKMIDVPVYRSAKRIIALQGV